MNTRCPARNNTFFPRVATLLQRTIPGLSSTVSIDCTRTQFPLRIAYAITVHKAQGLTLPRIVLNITGKDFALGLSYVAISRVKTFDGLLFDEFSDLERFATPATDITRWREEDFALRTSQMI